MQKPPGDSSWDSASVLGEGCLAPSASCCSQCLCLVAAVLGSWRVSVARLLAETRLPWVEPEEYRSSKLQEERNLGRMSWESGLPSPTALVASSWRAWAASAAQAADGDPVCTSLPTMADPLRAGSLQSQAGSRQIEWSGVAWHCPRQPETSPSTSCDCWVARRSFC